MKANNIKWNILFLIFISFPVLATQGSKIQKSLIGAMHRYKIPVLSIGVIRAGKTSYIADLHRNNDGTIKIDSGITRFRIASVSKIFTTQAIMQLVEKGKISLDDKVSMYIPELKSSGVTIRQLLTHYGGLQDKVWPEPFDPNSSFNRYLSKVLSANPDIKPGTEFQYSDTGFNLLGKIIFSVSGLSYSTYIEKNILQPSGMHASGYYSGENGLRPSVEPFKNGQIISQDQRWPFDPQFFPSEGLITDVIDLNRWTKMMLEKSPEILKKSSYQEMLAPSHAAMEGASIGLGWFKMTRNGIAYTYHMGGIRGYESIVAMDINTKNAIILLTNSSDVPRWEIVDLIEQTMRADDSIQKHSVH
jgi:CubicO group peptidase (beta-lactamase class C family)